VLLSTFTSISVLCVPVVRIVGEAANGALTLTAHWSEAVAACLTVCKGRSARLSSRERGREGRPKATLSRASSGEVSSESLSQLNAYLDEACEAMREASGSSMGKIPWDEMLGQARHGVDIEQSLEAQLKQQTRTAPLSYLAPTEVNRAGGQEDATRSGEAEGCAAGASGDDEDGMFQPCDTLQVLIKVSLLILAAVIAVSVPNFGYVVSIIGAITCMLMSFILPAACNVIVHWHLYASHVLLLNGLIICLGFAGMVVGVQSTIARES